MKVLAPWTDMKVQEENTFIVDVWGGTYTFENNLFPTSIITKDEELLSGPIALKMDFGYGEEVSYNYQYRILEAKNDKIIVASAALCGNLIVSVAVALKYDGFIKIALRLVPHAADGIVTIPMKRANIYMLHFLKITEIRKGINYE